MPRWDWYDFSSTPPGIAVAAPTHCVRDETVGHSLQPGVLRQLVDFDDDALGGSPFVFAGVDEGGIDLAGMREERLLSRAGAGEGRPRGLQVLRPGVCYRTLP